ncbi:hypothetical protein Aperf_G00000078517 [Anoplocephala perfoliata]
MLYLITITTNGLTVYSSKTSGSNSIVSNPDTLSTPEVQKIMSESRLADPVHEEESTTGSSSVKPIVWIWSTVAVVIISALSLLGAVMAPLTNKKYYNDFLQFLVALAVGCLTGDAFLHLLPHAFSEGHGHSHDEGEDEAGKERIAVLKGLLGSVGIYIFFLAEKLVSTITEHRIEKAAEQEEVRSDGSQSRNGIHRSSTSRESISVTPSFRGGPRIPYPDGGDLQGSFRASSIITDDVLTTGLTAKAMKTVDVLNTYNEEGDAEDEELATQRNKSGGTIIQASTINTAPDIKIKSDTLGSKDPALDDIMTPTTEILDASHGHSHNLPTSMASVAWMVIMGDGLHNFTDGIAIGIAFADSIAGGISTTIAVFFHELPSELGEFAVLLKTGLSIKEALFFNAVSSLLCFVGMLIGIGVSNIKAANSWIFAFTAGTFVYIALVDMLPELNSFQVKPGKSRVVQFFIHNAGLITGTAVMLVIAMFEEQLLHLVG